MEIKTLQTNDGPILASAIDLADVGEWPATIAQLRAVVASHLIVGPRFGSLPREVLQYAPTQREVEAISSQAADAFAAGRVIDFGFLPNHVIMAGGNRGGPLYSRGAIGHPFSAPWVLYHTWDQGTALYLVNPCEPDKLAGGDCEVAELNPIEVKGKRLLAIGDRVLLQPAMVDEADRENWSRYGCHCAPSVWRYLPGAEAVNGPDATPEGAAAGNVLDPLMTALLILSTRGIARETVKATDKLNRARAKSGKLPIPPYDRVNSEPYVTALALRRSAAGPSKGGTHASPVPHIRRGHLRTYPSGVTSFVRDSLVNFTDEARAAAQINRSHYVVKP